MELLYSVKYIAQFLELTEETVRVKLRKGDLHGVKIGKSWRVLDKDLKLFLKNR